MKWRITLAIWLACVSALAGQSRGRAASTAEWVAAAGTPVQALAPSPTRPATATPRPTAAQPAILSFTVAPTATLNLGDTLDVNWRATGDTAELCGILATGPAGCRTVPVTGSVRLKTGKDTVQYIGLALRVRRGDQATMAGSSLKMECRNWRTWFFANPPARCPSSDPTRSAAAFQPFEHGFMIWTEADDSVYVFYDEVNGQRQFERVLGPFAFAPGASPDNRIDEGPPPGLRQPVSGFGQAWRGEIGGFSDVRARLGWATAPESSYESRHQCEMPAHPRLWNCFLSMPDGSVLNLRPDSSAQVRYLWEPR